MFKKHYGAPVNSEEAVTGVLANNSIEFLQDEMFHRDGVNVAMEEYCQGECPNKEECSECDFEASPSDIWFIGKWQQDADGLWEPDQTGEYSAIVGEIYTQVLWSRFTERCQLCSPCFPGQGDIGSKGEFLAFTMPPEIVGGVE